MLLRTAAIALLLTSLGGPAAAYGDAVHQEIALQSARLMPASLRSVLAAHSQELKAGAGTALVASPGALELRPGSEGGSLDRTVAAHAERVVELLKQRAPLEMAVREMGVLSRAVALASDPLHVTDPDGHRAEWADDFQRFVDERQPRFRVAFGGYASPDLDKDDVAGFVGSCAERTRASCRLLPSLFVLDDGTVARISGMDDRHPAFGVASIGYSHAVTNTARLWLWAWIKAGGDTAGLPFPQSLPAGPAGR